MTGEIEDSPYRGILEAWAFLAETKDQLRNDNHGRSKGRLSLARRSFALVSSRVLASSAASPLASFAASVLSRRRPSLLVCLLDCLSLLRLLSRRRPGLPVDVCVRPEDVNNTLSRRMYNHSPDATI